MRKITTLTLSALTIAGAVMAPLQANAAPVQQKCSNVVVIKGNSIEDIKSQLSNYGINCDNILDYINSGNCGIQNGDNTTETPSTPETPETPSTPETPETPSTPETPGAADDTALSYAEQVVKLVNEERAKAGLKAVTLDEKVTNAALVRAKETVTSFSHTRPNGTSFSTALTEAGVSYRGSGENIAWGQKTPEEVMTGWMNSSGHRANILNSNYTKIGVGYYQSANGTNYWTQLFTY